VAKTYRTLKLTYNTTTEEIDVRTVTEDVERVDLISTRQAIDGTRYQFKTGYKRTFTYSFDFADSDVYDFFQDAFDAFDSGIAVTFDRELDDSTFETFEVIMNRPIYLDDNITTTGKIYRDLSVELLEI